MRRLSFLFLLVLCSTPLVAHHNVTHTYSTDKPVPLSGTVSAVQWKNPHVLVYIDTKGGAGAVVNWKVEMVGPLGGMVRLGLNRDSLKVGDAISLTACPAKDGSHAAAAHEVNAPSVLGGKRVGLC